MSDPSAAAPFVSVIVPCRNEAPFISRFVESVLAIEHPREKLEITFVDGMSTDGTREFLETVARRHDFIRVVDNPKLIVPVAMNMGLRRARGEYIVRMDAHSEFPPDYVARCLRLLRATETAGNAGGRVVNAAEGRCPWGRAVAFVTGHVFGVGNGAWRISERPGFVDTVPCGTFRREVLDRVGWFDERLTRNQDNELNARLQRSGYKIAFDPEIRIRYWNQGTLPGLLRQGFHTGIWNVYTLILHPYTWKARRFAPAAFALYLLALAVWAPPLRGWASVWALPAALYAALVLAFAASSARTGCHAPRVAATFACYHLAYGVGTLWGVFNLLSGRWRGHLGRPVKR